MLVNFKKRYDRIIGIRPEIINENEKFELNDLPSDVLNCEYSVVNGKVVHLETSVELKTRLQEDKLNYLRSLREPLLKAYDVYKINVLYGIVTETEEEHKAILEWYKNLLDLNTQTLNTKEAIPPKIAYYL